MYEEFEEQEIKVVYKDGTNTRIGRGHLVGHDQHNIKIRGPKGTLIIGKHTIEKISKVKNWEED